jgi:hypothetical protein
MLLILTIIVSPFVIFRLSLSEPKRFEREVRFQVIDFGQNGGIRYWFEYKRGNKRLFLVPEDSIPTWVYVSPNDFAKCWSVPWPEMKRDTFTIVAVLESKPLLFGNDYTPARLLETKRVKKFPVVRK